jgi:ABC-2 type transport system ATP-binding protein
MSDGPPRGTSDEAVISTSQLRKSFGTGDKVVHAVKDVNLAVQRGEIFGFLGPNGAGKTTTLRMLTTLLPIDGGSATVAGFDVGSQAREVRRRIGFVSQLGGADPDATGKENVILQGRLYGLSAANVERRTDELLGSLDLGDFADRLVKTYSGGQRRRLDIALGIVHEPEVLFLDEPSTGLDPQSRANLWDHVRRLRETGTTIFLTTHYLDEADALSGRLAIMDHGEIVAEGTPIALKRDVAGESVVVAFSEGAAAAARAVGILEAQDFVHDLSRDDDEVRLYVAQGSTALPLLLRVLDAEALGIRTIQLSEPTLDDVFLRHTGRSLRDDETPKRQEVAS